MPAIQISDELDANLDQLVRQTGGSKEAYVSEAVRNLLEDAEDLALAKERISRPGRRFTLDEVERHLGLAD
ncbi:type II toxin-antitoxin system RelB family antitoxin [Granulicella tundricola]|uniref:CopG domain-containing protein DNA-binding domain-containing protein n=1 Tax=Granulicella tundricola (strain ATCC BAA-1859 / DSM 23138 / MP5ACTX9) TaxID=1198114 RepID=E8X232_GRATM|nr:CopG domain-containing protein DNA-binding domain-containing protein [Granulicella tundricola MP5ACTX9]